MSYQPLVTDELEVYKVKHPSLCSRLFSGASWDEWAEDHGLPTRDKVITVDDSSDGYRIASLETRQLANAQVEQYWTPIMRTARTHGSTPCLHCKNVQLRYKVRQDVLVWREDK